MQASRHRDTGCGLAYVHVRWPGAQDVTPALGIGANTVGSLLLHTLIGDCAAVRTHKHSNKEHRPGLKAMLPSKTIALTQFSQISLTIDNISQGPGIYVKSSWYGVI